MTSLDLTQIELKNLITHHVGSKLRDEKFKVSHEESIIASDTKDFLLRYFLLSIKSEEFYSFFHPLRLDLNEIYTLADEIFLKSRTFISSSQNIAKLLYEQSMHPKIKGGKLNIAYFSNIALNDEIVEAIGIFKSETHVPFLKMKSQNSKFSIQHEYGFEIKGMDKGCLIFNTNKQQGYKIVIIDNINKSTEAQYWKDEFLKVKPISDEFHQTNQFLGITKNFVTKQLSEDMDLSKADKIDLLNRSVNYFKTHESFDKQEFESEVFQNEDLITSFQNFDSNYRLENEIEIPDDFSISVQAVKKQAKVFKSVLKLDKNFHIYIHGSKDLIEQGIDSDGRKFYKIYFEQES